LKARSTSYASAYALAAFGILLSAVVFIRGLEIGRTLDRERLEKAAQRFDEEVGEAFARVRVAARRVGLDPSHLDRQTLDLAPDGVLNMAVALRVPLDGLAEHERRMGEALGQGYRVFPVWPHAAENVTNDFSTPFQMPLVASVTEPMPATAFLGAEAKPGLDLLGVDMETNCITCDVMMAMYLTREWMGSPIVPATKPAVSIQAVPYLVPFTTNKAETKALGLRAARQQDLAGVVIVWFDPERLLRHAQEKSGNLVAVDVWTGYMEFGQARRTNRIATVGAYGPTVDSGKADTVERRLRVGERYLFITARHSRRSSFKTSLITSAVAVGILSLSLVGAVSWGQGIRDAERHRIEAERLRVEGLKLVTRQATLEQVRRDLHDGALQTVYGLGLGIEKARRLAPADAAAAERLLGRCLEDVRRLSGDLRQTLTGTGGDELADLTVSLSKMFQPLRETHLAEIELRLDPLADELVSPQEAAQLLLIAKEAVSNALRHGRARHLAMRLRRPENTSAEPAWILEIRDDGCGFAAISSGGNGLRNMRARAHSIGGTCEIESQPGVGTCVMVRIPPRSAVVVPAEAEPTLLT
jgi:signal transduction histidine kinase